jgi:hypothetical protein
MLYYTINVKCHHCLCDCPWAVQAETEPPSDAVITIYCPSHGGPIRLRFQYFKPAESLPPDVPVSDYPPKPPKPPTPYYPPGESRSRWWQFWKW